MPTTNAVPREHDSLRGCSQLGSSARITGSKSRRSANGLEAAALATLDKLSRGVVLIDGMARAGFLNRAAREMLGHQAGLSLRNGRLEFSGREAARRFEQYLSRAADEDGGGSLVLRVAGPTQQDAYRVLVSPLQRHGLDADAAYCVFIYQPDAGNRPLPGKVLGQLYGLTPSESRLVNALFVGKSLIDAAQQVDVTVNTAKSVLKKVFAKCGVASQAELLQLLALGPRTL